MQWNMFTVKMSPFRPHDPCYNYTIRAIITAAPTLQIIQLYKSNYSTLQAASFTKESQFYYSQQTPNCG